MAHISDDDTRIVKKISIEPSIIEKMKKLTSLFADELPEGAKEIDIISFFVEKSFQAFLVSGVIDRMIEEIKG